MCESFDLAIKLATRAREEKARLAKRDAELEKARKNNAPWGRIYEIERRYAPTPTKTSINDSIRLARKLLMEEVIE